MRRFLKASLTGVLAAGCAGHEVTSLPAEPIPVPVEPALAAIAPPPPSVVASWRAVVDDALVRLVPALGTAGAALGKPFRTLRDAPDGKLDAQLVATTRKQFEAIALKLPPALGPDADALRLELAALGALVAN